MILGTGFGIALYTWCAYRTAMRTGDIAQLRGTLRMTVMADAWLTAPAVVFQALSGVALMYILGWPLVSPWSLAVWGLFLVTGGCWLPVVRLQIVLMREAERTTSMSALSERFHRRFVWWFALGVPAFTSVILIYWLMVAKPLSIT